MDIFLIQLQMKRTLIQIDRVGAVYKMQIFKDLKKTDKLAGGRPIVTLQDAGIEHTFDLPPGSLGLQCCLCMSAFENLLSLPFNKY